MSQEARKSIPFYKRRYIVYPEVQFEILTYFTIILSVMFGFLFWYALELLSELRHAHHLGLLPPPDHPYYRYLEARRIEIIRTFVLIFVSTVVFMIMGSAALSNRIVGPLYRLTKVLENLATGTPTEPIVLRKNDFFQSLANIVNQLIDRRSK